MHIFVRPTRATCKGDVKRQELDVKSADDVPEVVPCGNPDCIGGGIPLRDAVQRAVSKTARVARARCVGKEKDGIACWNMMDITVRD